jgi:hypothetical protein
MLHRALDLDGFFGMTQHKMDMKCGTWNVRDFYRSGSQHKAARELAKCKSDIVGRQEVSWNKGDTDPACYFKLFYRKGNDNHQTGTGFFIHKEITPSAKTAEFTV